MHHVARKPRRKIIIDAVNPLLPDLSGLTVGTTTSAAARLAALVPDARVVQAFNTIGATLIGHADFGRVDAIGLTASSAATKPTPLAPHQPPQMVPGISCGATIAAAGQRRR